MIVSDLNSLDCTALILAGGQARRFNGQDKGLLRYQGQTFVEHIAAKFPRPWPIFALTHNNQAAYQRLGFNCINDASIHHEGPMVVIPAASHQITSTYIVTCACDTPTVPTEVYQQLLDALRKGGNATYIATSTRQHYCCLAAKTNALQSISEKPRSMRHLLKLLNAKAVTTHLNEALFQNINSAEDLTHLVVAR